jgi:Zn finger protein HypA/HybF involved in hydrogenase expression
MSARASCLLCGRPTYDPDKRERPWARGVSAGRLVLICPRCQTDKEGWAGELDRCPRCGSIRLAVTLGQVLCRACGHTAPAR